MFSVGFTAQLVGAWLIGVCGAGAQLFAFVCALVMRDSQKHSLIADD